MSADTQPQQAANEAQPPAEIERRILSIPLHQWLETAQQSHGIPHHDYAQYHAYCTRRLSRLRHAKEVRKDLVHSSAYVSGSGGNKSRRHAYVPRNIVPAPPSTASDDDDDDTNRNSITTTTTTPKELHENVLWVLLVGAERAWAHAGELRAHYTEGSSSRKHNDNALSSLQSKSKRSPGQLRHHALRRLKRAEQLAKQLEKAAMQFTDSQIAVGNVVVIVDHRTVQECRAYASWMRGNWALEMADWKTACEEFRSAVTICRSLSQLAAEQAVAFANEKEAEEGDAEDVTGDTTTTVAENLELRDLFTTRAENILPLLKYCQYEWREANGGTLPETWDDQDTALSTTTSTIASKNVGGGSMISFRGQEIPIENKTLRVLLLKADGLVQQQKQQQQEQNPATASTTDQDSKFATLLSTYDDAMSLVTQDLKNYEGAKAGPAVNAKHRELDLLSGYIQHEKLSATCRRLEDLLPHLTEDAEIVHVYDALLQDARAILSLPSANSANSGNNEPEEDEFWLQANANVLRIRAFRCYYLAKLYSASGQHYGQAKALLQQSKQLSTRAMEEIAACDEDMEHGKDYMESLQKLQQDLVAMTCRAKAQAYLSSRPGASRSFYNYSSGAKGGGTNRSLLIRLADFDPGNGQRLADVPPDVLPLPCKPSFYDVAWNYASQFPDLQQVTDQRQSNKQKSSTTTSGGGLFGWFGGGK